MSDTTTDTARREAAIARARQIAAERQERERNWKRLVLIGAFASFTAFSGIIASQDRPEGNTSDQPSLSAPANGRTPSVLVPRIRTRTS
jgi:hypothetical protein